jgi:phospholipid-translocating ATPase
VSKIETVGKTYLACSGLKDFDSDLSPSIKEVTHARRALEMAFSVLHESKKTILKSGNRLKMKIGIHSGPVVAGVVGYHKPQFSLVGDTVNTASRMASTLETYDQVQISLETFTLLENDTEGFLFTNNYREVKGKGKMKTFIVQAEVGENVMQAKGSSFSLASTSFEKSVKHKKIIKEDEVEVSWFSYFRNNSLTLREKLVQIFYLESQTDKEFQQFFDTHTRSLQLVGLLISFFHNLFSIIASSIQYSSSRSNSSLSTLLLYTCEEFLTILLIFYLKFQKSSKILFFTLQFILISEILIFFIKDLKKEINFQISLLLFFLRFLQLNFCTSFLFFRNLLTNLISISLLISKLSLLNDSADNYLFSFFFIICTLFSTYFREAKLRKDFRLREKFQKEHKKTEGLLNQMLPSQVVFKLQREVNVVENISTVTVIYADIVGFTQWSSTRSPPEVISMLSELFTRFDRLCLEFSVYKVYTIGDCYVAMGYEGKDRRNPVKEAVMTMNFAFELLKVIQEVNEKIDAGLNMRIGLHTGDIIGAITGTNIVRYDIYGKDVLIANKMESNGLAGMIHVSEKTKELIESTTEDLFNFSQFKQVKTWDSFITTYMVSKTIHS